MSQLANDLLVQLYDKLGGRHNGTKTELAHVQCTDPGDTPARWVIRTKANGQTEEEREFTGATYELALANAIEGVS